MHINATPLRMGCASGEGTRVRNGCGLVRGRGGEARADTKLTASLTHRFSQARYTGCLKHTTRDVQLRYALDALLYSGLKQCFSPFESNSSPPQPQSNVPPILHRNNSGTIEPTDYSDAITTNSEPRRSPFQMLCFRERWVRTWEHYTADQLRTSLFGFFKVWNRFSFGMA